jgi:hypothetical protein
MEKTMYKKLKATLTTAILIGLFFVSQFYGIILLQIMYWLLNSILIVVGIGLLYVSHRVKNNTINLTESQTEPLKKYGKIDLSFSLLTMLCYTVICLKFQSYNMLTYIVLSYIIIWFSYYDLLKSIKLFKERTTDGLE